jgi:hypothetical protein
MKYFQSSDSVRKYVLEHRDAIGVGYLSQITREMNLKPLSVSYFDSAGNYVFPHAVHQANIVQKFYPYIITHYVYIFDERFENPLRLARFLSKSGIAQRYFKDAGIVPAFAKIKLIDER